MEERNRHQFYPGQPERQRAPYPGLPEKVQVFLLWNRTAHREDLPEGYRQAAKQVRARAFMEMTGVERETLFDHLDALQEQAEKRKEVRE